MKKYIVFICFIIFLPAVSSAEIPSQIAGFVLGDDISAYKDKLRPDSEMSIRHMECLKEVEIKKKPGFKSGLIYYGTCTGQKRILRIKLKYEDASADFYKELLKEYKKRFGEPDEWKGDPFHVVLAWKWRFKDKNDNKIIMILQHNTGDEGEKMGNSVKLTLHSLMEAELLCYKNKESAESGEKEEQKTWKKKDWDMLVPR